MLIAYKKAGIYAEKHYLILIRALLLEHNRKI